MPVKSILTILAVLTLPATAFTQQRNTLTVSFAAGGFWRQETSSLSSSKERREATVLGGAELIVGSSRYRPSLSLLFGDGEGEIAIGFIASEQQRGKGLIPYWGAAAVAYDIETYRAMARAGIYAVRSRDLGLSAEARIYGTPLEPAVVLGIVFKPPF